VAGESRASQGHESDTDSTGVKKRRRSKPAKFDDDDDWVNDKRHNDRLKHPYRVRKIRCGKCDACLTPECGKCDSCRSV